MGSVYKSINHVHKKPRLKRVKPTPFSYSSFSLTRARALDESGKIRVANDSAQRMLGWKESELLGKSSHKTFYHTEIDGKPISKEECPSFQVLKNGFLQKRFNAILWRKDGSSFPVEYAVSPIWKKGKIAGTVEFFLDITERKKAEEELLHKDSLLENVSNAIIATDLNFGIKSWNKAAEEIYGWTEEEAIGKKLKNVTGIEYLHMNEEQVVERFSKEARWEYEVIEKRKNGSSINVFASVSLVKDRTGNPIGLVAVNRDIPERKKIEETLLASLHRYRSFIEVAGELGWFPANLLSRAARPNGLRSYRRCGLPSCIGMISCLAFNRVMASLSSGV